MNRYIFFSETLEKKIKIEKKINSFLVTSLFFWKKKTVWLLKVNRRLEGNSEDLKMAIVKHERKHLAKAEDDDGTFVIVLSYVAFSFSLFAVKK